MKHQEVNASHIQIKEDTWIVDTGTHHQADIVVEKGVRVWYTVLPQENAHIERHIHLQEDALFEGSAVCVHSGDIQITTDIKGNHVHATMNILAIVTSGIKISVEGISRVSLPYRGVFTRVDQTNILVGTGATVRGVPRLDIATDDIEGGHSCRIHELGWDALFYLTSRGLERSDAETLLLNSEIARHLSTVPKEKQDEYCREIHFALREKNNT